MSSDASARTRILDAALPYFAERGYENTTLDALVRAAGTTRAHLERSFPTKSALFALLLDREVRRLRDAVIAAVPTEAGEGTAGQAVARALDRLLASVRRDRAAWCLLLHGDFGSFADDRASTELRATMRARLTWLIVSAARLGPAERRRVAGALAAMLAALVECSVHPAASREPAPTPADVGAALDRLLATSPPPR